MVRHPVNLRGYQAAINDRSAEPVIVQRLDQEFIPGLLDGLRRKLSPNELGRIQNGSSPIRLFQPIHRAFNLVLLEAVCDRPGSPRLNPLDIASAGFVVRRVQTGGDEGWMLRDEQVVGWARPMEADLDPDPAYRKPRLNAGHAHINGQLARLHAALEPPAERVSRLFVAPPDVCAAARRTLLYGLIPVTSSERSEETPSVEIDSDIVRQTMPGFLAGPPFNTWPDLLGRTLSLASVNEAIASDPKASISRLMQDLRLMHFGWHAFDPTDGVAILPLLDKVTLNFADSNSETLGTFLARLVHRFVARDDGSEASLVMPSEWPQPEADLAAQLQIVVRQSLQARLAEGVPNEQRFEDATASYRIHAFIRVRPDGCPPVLQWAPPSAPFQIVPWWESGAGLLHTISLPDFDRDTIKKVKPNIAFKVPPRLAALLTQKPDDFLNGKAQDPGSGLTLGWICSFSIPIITLCAFIVLNIFLALLHVVFWWLFYIKICLPFPKPQTSSS
jgi:hypothetical protein